jgi:hypothetical protein
MKTQIIKLLFLVSLPFEGLLGQTRIELKNPSFEADEPAAGIVPKAWINLGALDQTPQTFNLAFLEFS